MQDEERRLIVFVVGDHLLLLHVDSFGLAPPPHAIRSAPR